MYIILVWEDGLKIDHIANEDGSIRLFATLEEADAFANNDPRSDDMRVISIEAVR